MLNFGLGELVLIAAIALVFVGPQRLPEMLRTLGRLYGKVRAATYDIRKEFTIESDRAVAEERAQLLRERREENRRRLVEERAKRLEEQGEAVPPPEKEYVPFDQNPTTSNTPEDQEEE
jgi:sec-independent protein translocase protein TatB